MACLEPTQSSALLRWLNQPREEYEQGMSVDFPMQSMHMTEKTTRRSSNKTIPGEAKGTGPLRADHGLVQEAPIVRKRRRKVGNGDTPQLQNVVSVDFVSENELKIVSNGPVHMDAFTAKPHADLPGTGTSVGGIISKLHGASTQVASSLEDAQVKREAANVLCLNSPVRDRDESDGGTVAIGHVQRSDYRWTSLACTPFHSDDLQGANGPFLKTGPPDEKERIAMLDVARDATVQLNATQIQLDSFTLSQSISPRHPCEDSPSTSNDDALDFGDAEEQSPYEGERLTPYMTADQPDQSIRVSQTPTLPNIAQKDPEIVSCVEAEWKTRPSRRTSYMLLVLSILGMGMAHTVILSHLVGGTMCDPGRS